MQVLGLVRIGVVADVLGGLVVGGLLVGNEVGGVVEVGGDRTRVVGAVGREAAVLVVASARGALSVAV